MSGKHTLASVGNTWGFEGQNRYAHAGMLDGALWIRNDLNQSQIIQRLLLENSGVRRR